MMSIEQIMVDTCLQMMYCGYRCLVNGLRHYGKIYGENNFSQGFMISFKIEEKLTLSLNFLLKGS
jgi:hypothetical protein